MDFHKYSLWKLAFMLNVTSKSENETFLITESRNVTWKVISNRIKARKSKSTEQYNCKLSFRLDGTCNSIVELKTQRAEILSRMIKFNASTGEESTVNDLSVVSVAPKSLSTWSKLKQVGFTVSSLFFPRPVSCGRQFTPNGSSFD